MVILILISLLAIAVLSYQVSQILNQSREQKQWKESLHRGQYAILSEPLTTEIIRVTNHKAYIRVFTKIGSYFTWVPKSNLNRNYETSTRKSPY
jgi:hypothetical protein